MSTEMSNVAYNRITTAGYCENPHEDPARMPRAGDAREWLAFVGVVDKVVKSGSPTLFIGGIRTSVDVLKAPQALYLNHAFECTLIYGFKSGVLRGVLNGRMGLGVPDPKVRLTVTAFDPYGRELLPFDVPIGSYVDLTMPVKDSVTTYLNLPLTWD